jgi:transposase-like protein
MLSVKEKWEQIYPNSMRRWSDNWDVICPIFKFSAAVRKVLYTTNAIEGLNSQFRRINSARSIFPIEESLKKAIFLSTQLITKNRTAKIRNWGQIYGELSILFDGRI